MNAPPLLLHNVPGVIKALRQIVAWKYLPPKGKDKKPRKLLINPHTGRAARTHNDAKKEAAGLYTDRPEDTWGTWEEVMRALKTGRYEGPGFVFTEGNPYGGIDLDDCRDPETGHIEAWAQEIIDEAGTYAEVSPSRTGIKLIGEFTLPPDADHKADHQTGAVEIYCSRRFFTLTGWHLSGTPTTVNNCQEAINRIYARVFASKSEKPKTAPLPRPIFVNTLHVDDNTILEMACTDRDGAKFGACYAGSWQGYFKSQNSADLYVCGKLAYYWPDEATIDRLIRNSGLMRDKWDEMRGATPYGVRTIRRAIEGKTQFYEWPGSAPVVVIGGARYSCGAAGRMEAAPQETDEQAEKQEDASEEEASDVDMEAAAPPLEPEPNATTSAPILKPGSIGAKVANTFIRMEEKLIEKGCQLLGCYVVMPPGLGREDYVEIGKIVRAPEDLTKTAINFLRASWYSGIPRPMRGFAVNMLYGGTAAPSVKAKNEQKRFSEQVKIASRIPSAYWQMVRSWRFYEAVASLDDEERRIHWLKQRTRKGIIKEIQAEFEESRRPKASAATTTHPATAAAQRVSSTPAGAASSTVGHGPQAGSSAPSSPLSASVVNTEPNLPFPVFGTLPAGQEEGQGVKAILSPAVAGKLEIWQLRAQMAGLTLEAYLEEVEKGTPPAPQDTEEKQVDTPHEIVDNFSGIRKSCLPVLSTNLQPVLDMAAEPTPEAEPADNAPCTRPQDLSERRRQIEAAYLRLRGYDTTTALVDPMTRRGVG
ncbi:MAG TPA: hypothetical protein VKU00_15840 [Chthonomonadaceae bacterium]|nr:hypothetical protein [Chthonomonadaceae bacterium]